MKENARYWIIGGAIIVGFVIHSLLPRYYVHTAYNRTTIVDRWTGKPVSH